MILVADKSIIHVKHAGNVETCNTVFAGVKLLKRLQRLLPV